MSTDLIEKVSLVEKQVTKSIEVKKKRFEQSFSRFSAEQQSDFAASIEKAKADALKLVEKSIKQSEKDAVLLVQENSERVANLKSRFSKNKSKIVQRAAEVILQ